MSISGGVQVWVQDLIPLKIAASCLCHFFNLSESSNAFQFRLFQLDHFNRPFYIYRKQHPLFLPVGPDQNIYNCVCLTCNIHRSQGRNNGWVNPLPLINTSKSRQGFFRRNETARFYGLLIHHYLLSCDSIGNTDR